MQKLFLNGSSGFYLSGEHWFLFTVHDHRLQTLTGISAERAQKETSRWPSTELSPAFQTALVKELESKIHPKAYPEWLHLGKVKILGGPTSDEIVDFTHAEDLTRKIHQALFTESAYYFRFL